MFSASSVFFMVYSIFNFISCQALLHAYHSFMKFACHTSSFLFVLHFISEILHFCSGQVMFQDWAGVGREGLESGLGEETRIFFQSS